MLYFTEKRVQMTERQLVVYNHKKAVLSIKKNPLDKTIEAGQQLVSEVNSVAEKLMEYVGECEDLAPAIGDLIKASSHYQRQVIDALREERNE